jgi:hypothetical protein
MWCLIQWNLCHFCKDCKKKKKKKDECGKVIYFQSFGENCMRIITTGHIFLSNHELSRFSKQPGKFVLSFSSLGYKFKLKFELSWNFKLYSFELTRFCCNSMIPENEEPFNLHLVSYINSNTCWQHRWSKWTRSQNHNTSKPQKLRSPTLTH